MSEVVIDTTKVSERGQIVIPKEIRDRLGLKSGTRMIMIATNDTLILQRVDLIGEKMRAWEIINKARSLAEKLGLRKIGI